MNHCCSMNPPSSDYSMEDSLVFRSDEQKQFEKKLNDSLPLMIDNMNVRRLSWGDFQGKPDTNMFYWAHIYWNISYGYQIEKRKSQVDPLLINKVKDLNINVKISPKSWVRTQSDYLLSHEQGHYLIGCLCALDFKIQAITKKYSSNYVEEIKQIFNTTLKQYCQMEQRYDDETNHALNTEKQTQWFQFLHDQLMKQQNFFLKRKKKAAKESLNNAEQQEVAQDQNSKQNNNQEAQNKTNGFFVRKSSKDSTESNANKEVKIPPTNIQNKQLISSRSQEKILKQNNDDNSTNPNSLLPPPAPAPLLYSSRRKTLYNNQNEPNRNNHHNSCNHSLNQIEQNSQPKQNGSSTPKLSQPPMLPPRNNSNSSSTPKSRTPIIFHKNTLIEENKENLQKFINNTPTNSRRILLPPLPKAVSVATVKLNNNLPVKLPQQQQEGRDSSRNNRRNSSSSSQKRWQS